MKPDYKKWMPKGMILGFLGGTAAALILCLFFGYSGLLAGGAMKTVLTVVFAALTVLFSGLTVWGILMYRAFSYNGNRQMSRQIIAGVAARVKLPDSGTCLDVGCGSGALAIAVAKSNPKGQVIGVDRWGKEYASFSKALCESNAKAEGVDNAAFQQGDAAALDFPDEQFDAVTSNYVYHNIPSRDRQVILLETLRTLKKGGVFAIHDIMSPSKYGDMEGFVRKLREMGYREAELIDTTDGMFMTRKEARWMMLSDSTLLTGIK